VFVGQKSNHVFDNDDAHDEEDLLNDYKHDSRVVFRWLIFKGIWGSRVQIKNQIRKVDPVLVPRTS
jgi:hypothetical protein